MCDKNSGQCVHVDFDCLFDKGLSLSVPEVVPFRFVFSLLDILCLRVVLVPAGERKGNVFHCHGFGSICRLTPNMVNAFGVTGCDGAFRKVCEIMVRVMRSNRGSLRLCYVHSMFMLVAADNHRVSWWYPRFADERLGSIFARPTGGVE